MRLTSKLLGGWDTAPPKKVGISLVISGGFPTCRRNTSGFHIMRPPRISSDSWLIFYHEFIWILWLNDWIPSDSTVWALKGSSVLLRGKLRIWFALSPWRYLHGCWLHCPQRPDAGDSTFGRSRFDFICYAKQPRSCHQGKRWNGEILRLSWISLIVWQAVLHTLRVSKVQVLHPHTDSSSQVVCAQIASAPTSSRVEREAFSCRRCGRSKRHPLSKGDCRWIQYFTGGS